MIYEITGIFVAPFAGIFNGGGSEGVQSGSIFESATVVAIIVYLVLAWGIVQLIQIVSGRVERE